ncbi:MAG: T9SS type A sorting domain-containing protein, partial [Balneolales bacterium]|nr:T9SS type A sorting domain-containing protein [Balneolales bacterium]
NPFNPTTQISYDLPETAEVRLEVYNVMGQRVALLVSETQTAGTHNLSFNASSLASGVYIYRLQVGNETLTRKMTLIK